jgi:hypothetical protein
MAELAPIPVFHYTVSNISLFINIIGFYCFKLLSNVLQPPTELGNTLFPDGMI